MMDTEDVYIKKLKLTMLTIIFVVTAIITYFMVSCLIEYEDQKAHQETKPTMTIDWGDGTESTLQ